MNQLISVIIPCYNQAHFLSDAIESVLNQTYHNTEIIVIDDGSTDDTFDIATKYKQVKCIRQGNKGVAHSRNNALKYIHGEFVVFLDADDLLLSNALRIGLNTLRDDEKLAFTYGHIKLIDEKGLILEIPDKETVEQNFYKEFLKYNYIWTPGAVMFRKSVLDSIGSFDPNIVPCEDWEIYLRLTKRYPIKCNNTYVLGHRRHKANVTNNSALLLECSIRLLRMEKKNIKDKSYLVAVNEGIERARKYYGTPLKAEIYQDFRDLRLLKMCKGVIAFLKY